MNKEEDIVHCVQLKDGRKVIVESLVEEIDLSRLDRKRLENAIEYWQKEAQDKQSVERENNVLKLNRQSLQSQLDIANKKLEEIEEYIKENACYDEKTKECKCSFSSMALDKILEIIGGE